jgi:asparagine synthase (glutamine-hydrolysing)
VCGICGVIQLRGEPRPVVSPEILDRMTDAMIHRGPSDRGTYIADGVAIGARRLSIVDVHGGHQPVHNEDGSVWAAQNGELYNHLDLRRDLAPRGHGFRSDCDTDIIPHVYEEFGPGFSRQLRGKFAIAVWDGRRRRAVLARDRLGVKPLYYAISGDLLVFGSELKSVLASGIVGTDLDYDAIDVYLNLGFFPGARTPLAGVHKLLPGHQVVVQDGGYAVEEYWAYPEPQPGPADLAAEDWAEGFLEGLDESVRLRLMSDVPLGAMLSGGLDSSLIVALMARHMSEPVKTFSIGFREAGDDNELDDARFVSSVFGTDHHEIELSYVDDTVDLADLVWHLDEPIADLSALGFHALSHLAAQHVTVALSGQGADELFGGYAKHSAASLIGSLQRVPGARSRLVGALGRRGPDRLQRMTKALTADDPVERLLAASGRLDDPMRRRLLRGPLAGRGVEGTRSAIGERLGNVDGDPLASMLYLDAQLAMVDDMLHYFDRTSMAHSLEVRVPFLDHHVVEYCARIPSSLKVRRLNRKYSLKLASRGIVPDRVIEKRKLGFFRRASSAWLQAQMPEAVDRYLLAGTPAIARFVDRPTLDGLILDHRAGRNREHVHLLIALLMLEIWLATYLPRASSTGTTDVRERIAV